MRLRIYLAVFLLILFSILTITHINITNAVGPTFIIRQDIRVGDLQSSVRLTFLNTTNNLIRLNFTSGARPMINIDGHEPSNIAFTQVKGSGGSGKWIVITDTEPVLTGPATKVYFAGNKTLQLTYTGNGTVLLSFVQNFLVSLADTLTFSDTLTRLLNLGRSLTDTLTLSETLTRLLVLGRSISETLALTDSISRVATLAREIAETLTISDSLTTAIQKLRSMSDTLSLSDDVARLIIVARGMTETVSISESVTKGLIYLKSMVDTLSISDSILRLTNIFRAISETLGISETLSRILSESVSKSGQIIILTAQTYSKTEPITLTLPDRLEPQNIILTWQIYDVAPMDANVLILESISIEPKYIDWLTIETKLPSIYHRSNDYFLVNVNASLLIPPYSGDIHSINMDLTISSADIERTIPTTIIIKIDRQGESLGLIIGAIAVAFIAVIILGETGRTIKRRK